MFPASAGMNRSTSRRSSGIPYVPRERGDEPGGVGELKTQQWMFPASAGMNRLLACHRKTGRFMFPASAGMNRMGKARREALHNVPRERGDEP